MVDKPQTPAEVVQAVSRQTASKVQSFVDRREDLFGTSAAPQTTSQPAKADPGDAGGATDIAAGPKGQPQGEELVGGKYPIDKLGDGIHELIQYNKRVLEQNQALFQRVVEMTAPKTAPTVDEDLKALVEESAIDGDRLSRVIDRRAEEKANAAAESLVQRMFGPVLAVAEADAKLAADPKIGEEYLSDVFRLNSFIESDPETKALYDAGIAAGKVEQARRYAYLRMREATGQARVSRAEAAQTARSVVVADQKPHAGLPSTAQGGRTQPDDSDQKNRLRESLLGAAATRRGDDPNFVREWFRPFSPSNEALQRLWDQGNLPTG